MIAGIGVDLVEIAQLRDIMVQNVCFRDRVFTTREIACCEAQLKKHEHYAARFAAKEAAVKALGVGFGHGIGWQDIETTNAPDGRPSLQLYGACAGLACEKAIRAMYVSLTHTDAYASAFVIMEK